MAKLTRRVFIRQTSVSMATLGMLTALPRLAAIPEAPPDVQEAELSAVELAAPLVAHVRDVATGEIAVLAGMREIIFRDPELVMRLLKAAR